MPAARDIGSGCHGLLRALLALQLPAAWLAEGTAANIVGGGCCATSHDPSHDYFPDKSTVDHAVGFEVEYFPSYKVVTIKRTGEKYVLFQRGTPQPSDLGQAVQPDVFIPVPIERSAVLSNSYFAYFELLGERRSMVVTTRHEYLNEPCLQLMASEGEILDGVTDRDLVNNNVFAAKDVDVIFRWSGSRDDELNNQATNPALPAVVLVDRDAETTAVGIMEWMEYVSLFFNREKEASRMVAEMKGRYDCIVASVSQQPTVKVLYASFSYRSSSSEVSCSFSISAWHQRMIEDVRGELIGEYPGFDSNGPCNMAAFREHAETADVWLYKGRNFQQGTYGNTWSVMWNISGEVASVKPFENGRTFEQNGNHFRDYWGSRMVELDVELEDLVKMLHPGLTYAHQRVWWLDVKTEADPGRPAPSDCTCKYGPQQLKANACPGNPATAPQGHPKPQGDYGCNGELASSVCAESMACPTDDESDGAGRAVLGGFSAAALLLLILQV